ncbi:ATP-binding protein [Streptomyces aidingensis]|uniref:AAA ATPase domain-containing protein n=1 Tax=Streptomyces aidingensis TaxID=910347 RepID=A0A1I1IXT6_9ACTN|nr:AAA family ATPase [Streptomyces aidingensis]SFC40985.1 AAA ATPase domain-containing protein [Streptomyces aidingensis]
MTDPDRTGRQAVPDGTARDARTPVRTLERENELLAVRAALAELTGPPGQGPVPSGPRRGGLLAFTGPAGVGKTTMLAHVRSLADERGCVTLSARGGEREQHMAFHVLRQLFQPLLARCSLQERRALLGDWYEIVGPTLGLLPSGAGPAPDPQGVRDGLDWVVTHLASRRGPLVLLVDDAHWADAESLGWLSGFASRTEDLTLLIAVAYRQDELPEQAAALGEVLERTPQRPMDLAPLTPVGIAQVMREALTGSQADVEPDDEFCREAWVVTAGLPFRAVELAAKVRDRRLVPREENIPVLRDMAAALQDSGLADQLQRMSSQAARLAWAVAVLGTEAPEELAASLAGLGPADVPGAVEELRTGRILKHAETLEFQHPLVATAVYRAIPAGMQVAMHGEAAWELVAAGHGATSAARHLLETQPEGDEWVAGQLLEAAREYVRAGAPESARRCLERALREDPPPPLRAVVLYELGAPALLRDPVVTVNHLRNALAEPGLDPDLRVRIVIRLARALSHCDMPAEAARLMAEEARDATDSRIRLRLHTEHFMQAVFTSDDEKAPARSRWLAQLAHRLPGRDRTERYLFGLRAWDAMVRGEPAEVAVDFAERALGSGLRWTDQDWGFEVPSLVALTFLYCDRVDTAEQMYSDGIAEYERQGWRGVHLSLGYTLLGYIRFRRGRLADGEDFVRAGLRLADRTGTRTHAHWYAVGALIEILIARGRIATAGELGVRHGFCGPFPSAVTIPDARTVHGELLLAQGMHKEAAEDLAEVGRRLDTRGMHNTVWCPWLPALALATKATDEVRARELAEDALRRAQRFGTATAKGEALLMAARMSDDPRERVDLLRSSVAEFERSPAEHEFADAQVELGAALRRSGRPHLAADHLYQGVELATRCGAEAVLAKARGELLGAGLRPRRLRVVR